MMIECRHIVQQLQPLLDDLLQEEEYQAMHSHITGCQNCRAHVRAVGSLSYTVQLLGEVEVPADLSSTILFQLREQPRISGSHRTLRSSWLILLVAAVLALILSGLFIARHHQSTSRPATTP